MGLPERMLSRLDGGDGGGKIFPRAHEFHRPPAPEALGRFCMRKCGLFLCWDSPAREFCFCLLQFIGSMSPCSGGLCPGFENWLARKRFHLPDENAVGT